MNFSRFDKYSRYLIGAVILIALLTYWRYRAIDLPSIYEYVAQQDVIHPVLFQNVTGSFMLNSIAWNFFGLMNRILMPHSIILLQLIGLAVMILNLILLTRLLDYMLGQKFWGFLCVFLVALSPFSVVAAVSGGSAAIAVTIALLFLMAPYKNQYIYAGILSGAAFAVNLPGLIMFLITILDLLQNSPDRKKVIRTLLFSAVGFFAVATLVLVYTMRSGNFFRFAGFSVPLTGRDLAWPLVGVIPLFVVNALNLVGVIYLLAKKRYDACSMHFHLLMLWITSCALSAARPSTSSLLFALVVSSILSMYFLQGLSSSWKMKLVSADTFLFLFVLLFLFTDVYANDRFLKDTVVTDSVERNEVISEVVSAVKSWSPAGPAVEYPRLVSSFVPAELSMKMNRSVYAVDGNLLPAGDLEFSGTRTLYVAESDSKLPRDTNSFAGQDSASLRMLGCKLLFSTSYAETGRSHVVQVIECDKSR